MDATLWDCFISFHGGEKILNWLAIDGIKGVLQAYTNWLIANNYLTIQMIKRC